MADSRLVSRLLIDRIAQAAQVVECDRAAFSPGGTLATSGEASDLYRSTRALLDLVRELHDAPLSEAESPPTLRTGVRPRPSWCLDLRPDGQCDGCPSYPCENIPGHER